MPNDKYFGDHITADMKVALKWLNTKLKKKSEISIYKTR